MLRNSLEHVAHDVLRALANMHVAIEENALLISVNGFSDSVPKILTTVFEAIKDFGSFCAVKENFDASLERLAKEAENNSTRGDPWFLVT